LAALKKTSQKPGQKLNQRLAISFRAVFRRDLLTGSFGGQFFWPKKQKESPELLLSLNDESNFKRRKSDKSRPPVLALEAFFLAFLARLKK
jgi:hypothetical protein